MKKQIELSEPEDIVSVWPGDFRAGDLVIVGNRIKALVVSTIRWFVPSGCVPVKYLGPCGGGEIKLIPADDMQLA
jgi:hypothetical protein